MKKFIIMTNKQNVYFLWFSYKNAFDKKITKRVTCYHDLEKVRKAAKRFVKNGYSLVSKWDAFNQPNEQ